MVSKEELRKKYKFMREKFPELAPQIDAFYSRAVYAPTDYENRISAIMDRLRIKYGFAPTHERNAPPTPSARRPSQLTFGMS